MKTFWMIFLIGLVLIGPAEAKLGESKKQLEERYGNATELPEKLQKYSLGTKCYTFKDENYHYIYFLIKDQAEALMLGKVKNKGSLTEEEVEKFLKENCETGFIKDKEQKADPLFTQVYIEPENKWLAIWEKGAGVMAICTPKWAERNGDEAFVKKYLTDEDIAKAKAMVEEERSKIKN